MWFSFVLIVYIALDLCRKKKIIYTYSVLFIVQMLNVVFRPSFRYPLDPLGEVSIALHSAVHSKHRVTCSEYNFHLLLLSLTASVV